MSLTDFNDKLLAAERMGARLRLLVVIFGIVVYTFLFDRSRTIPELAEALLALSLVYAVAVLVSKPRPTAPLRARAWALIAVDSVMTMLWLYATGGVDSPFFVALYLVVTGIAYRFSFAEALYAAATYGTAYVGLALLTGEIEARSTEILVRVVYLFFVGVLAGTLSRHILKQAMELTERRRDEKKRSNFIERIIAAQDEERRRIARELHDEAGQSLASLLVGLRALEERTEEPATREQAARLRAVTASTIDEVGRLARGLHPSVLDDLGFTAAIGRYAEDLMRLHALRIDVHVRGVEPSDKLPRVVATSLYRIIQEALTNVARHARAKSVSVVVDCDDQHVRAVVEDDGIGFEAEVVLRDLSQHGQLGLHGMRERAALLKGELAVDSKPGEGTTVAVTLPLAVDGTPVPV